MNLINSVYIFHLLSTNVCSCSWVIIIFNTKGGHAQCSITYIDCFIHDNCAYVHIYLQSMSSSKIRLIKVAYWVYYPDCFPPSSFYLIVYPLRRIYRLKGFQGKNKYTKSTLQKLCKMLGMETERNTHSVFHKYGPRTIKF